MKLCWAKILAADQDLYSFRICLKKFTSEKKEGERKENQHYSFSVKQSNGFQVCRPEVGSHPGRGAKGAGRKVLTGHYRDGH